MSRLLLAASVTALFCAIPSPLLFAADDCRRYENSDHARDDWQHDAGQLQTLIDWVAEPDGYEAPTASDIKSFKEIHDRMTKYIDSPFSCFRQSYRQLVGWPDLDKKFQGALEGAKRLLQKDVERKVKEREQIAARAKKAGFKTIDDDSGLLGVLRALAAGEKTMREAKTTLISLNSEDRQIEILQVIDKNNVLLRSPVGNIWLKNYARNGGSNTLLENATLMAVEFDYVAVRGTKNYASALMTSRQAIVVECMY